MPLNAFQEKTIQWFGHTVHVARWKQDGHDHVEVMINAGPDQLEYWGRGPNEAIALSNLEHEIRLIAKGEHLEDIFEYHARYDRKPPSEEMEIVECLQRNAQFWIEQHTNQVNTFA